jgi:hypothetical protein
MVITIKEVASLMSMSMAMSKYFPSIEKFYDAVEATERTTTEMMHSLRKFVLEEKDSKEKGEFEGMAS